MTRSMSLTPTMTVGWVMVMDDHDWEGAEELTQEEKDDLGVRSRRPYVRVHLLPVSWAVVVPVTLRSYSNPRSIGVRYCVSSSVQRVLVRTSLHGRAPIAGLYLPVCICQAVSVSR